MNRHRLLLIVALLLLAAVTSSRIILAHPAQAPTSTRNTVGSAPTSTGSPAGALSIAAIRAHPLTPGSIVIEQEIPARGGCRTFVVSYPSDGYKIYALMSRPSAPQPAAGYPVLILAHGYINPASYSTTGTDYQSFIDAYCNAGYLVLKPDYRGNGHSEGSAVGGHFSPGYAYDVLNLAASLHSLPQANPSRVALLGHSMGGHVVLRAAVASHDLPIKAVIFASGVVGSLEDIAYHWSPDPIPADIPPLRDQVVKTYGSPEQNPAFWHDASAINYVSGITAPVQIDHGTADSVVPLAFSRHLDAGLTAAHKPHEFITYPGGDHQYTDPAIRQQFLDNSIRFLHARL